MDSTEQMVLLNRTQGKEFRAVSLTPDLYFCCVSGFVVPERLGTLKLLMILYPNLGLISQLH